MKRIAVCLAAGLLCSCSFFKKSCDVVADSAVGASNAVVSASKSVARVSANAAVASVNALSFGSDEEAVPDVLYSKFQSSEHIACKDGTISLCSVSEFNPDRIWPTGSFISCAFKIPAEGSVVWDVDTPKSSMVAMQFSFAEDIEGHPGVWTGFVGPEKLPGRAYLNNNIPISELPDGYGWMRFKMTLRATKGVSPVCKSVRIGNALHCNWDGADDTAPEIRRISPVLSADPKAALIFDVYDDSSVDWHSLTLKLNGLEITSELKIQGTQLTYTPTTELATDRLHVYSVKIADGVGNVNEQDMYFMRTVGIPPKSVTQLRSDGAIVTSGRPFFPLVLVTDGCNLREQWQPLMSEVASAGFSALSVPLPNMISNGITVKEALELADQEGLKLIFRSTRVDTVRTYLQTALPAFGNPALLAWNLGDLGYGNTAQDLQRAAFANEAFHSLDPTHLTTASLLPMFEGEKDADGLLLNSSDCLMPRLCHDKMDLPQAVKSMELLCNSLFDAGKPVKCIIPLIDCREHVNDKLRSREALRQLASLALIHGGRGLAFKVSGRVDAKWKAELMTLAGELSALQQVFLSNGEVEDVKVRVVDGAREDALGNYSISTICRKVGKRKFLVCVNSSSADVKAQVSGKDLDFAKVWYENREITPKDNSFVDSFGPGQIHIYEIKKMFE